MNTLMKNRALLSSVVAVLVVAVSVIGQRRAHPPEQDFKVTAISEYVLLDVDVKNSKGARVTDLGQSNFQIYENGKLQAISHFSREDLPVTVGLVIDTSGSMKPKYAEVKTAALAFAGASNPNDEVFVVNFNDRVHAGLPDDVPFTADIEKLRLALSAGVPEGKTALYDAVTFALRHIESGRHAKKALVLVSDGGDNSSAGTLKDVMQRAQESRATIYTIGIFDEDDKDQNPGLLERLAHLSGGETFLPKDISQISSVCRQIADGIRNRYTIGYVPDRSDPKTLRKIKVVASQPGGPKLVVHTRTSYMLPSDSPLTAEVRQHK